MFIQGPSLSYKDYNTLACLKELMNLKLLSLGVSDQEDHRLMLSVLNATTNAKQQCIVAKDGTPEAKDDGHQDINNTFTSPSFSMYHHYT